MSVFSWHSPPRHFKLSSKQRPFCMHCWHFPALWCLCLSKSGLTQASLLPRNLSSILRILPQRLFCTFLMYRLSLSGGTSPVSFKNSLLSTVLFRSMLDYTGFDDSNETVYFLPACIYIAFYFLLHIIPESCYYTCKSLLELFDSTRYLCER